MTHDNNRSVTDSLPDQSPIGTDPSGHRSHGRTDGLTKKNSPSDSVSPNASPTNSHTIPPISNPATADGRPIRVLGDREIEEIKAALADPDYRRRRALDMQREGMVEVDNPFRTELRPRRATENTTAARPVVSVVARVLAADQLADAIALGEESWFWPVGGEVADVGDVLRDLQATRAEACRFADEYAALRAELAATESDLAVAVREASAVRSALRRARPVVATLAGMRIGSLRDPHAAGVLDLVDEALRNGGGR